MATCPVCDRQTEGLLCTACGYDASQNREAYPTLAPIPTDLPAISRLRSQCAGAVKTRLACPACGGYSFYIDLAQRTFQCTACKDIFSDVYAWSLLPPKPAPKSKPRKYRPPEVPDGCIVKAAGGKQKGQSDVSDWKNITALAAGWFHTVGLRRDGTVIATGHQNVPNYALERWKRIIAIAAAADYTVGLRDDGTVVTTSSDHEITKAWTNIQAISASTTHILGLKTDGTVVSTDFRRPGTEDWSNIQAIAACDGFSVGLKEDGTLVTSGITPISSQLNSWRNVVDIAAGDKHVIGLLSDGTVVTTAPHLVQSWKNVVAIAAGGFHSMALLQDGAVRSTDAFVDTFDWRNIVSIAMGRTHAVGLQRNR